MPIFRIHFEDGGKIDIDAETPLAARKLANKRCASIVIKIKKLKGKAHEHCPPSA